MADRDAYQFRYDTLKRPGKGLVRAFALKAIGYTLRIHAVDATH